MVCRNHICLKNFDSVCGSHLCKLTEQYRAESAFLKVVCDGKGNFSLLLVDGSIESVAHHALLITTTRHQSKGVVQVCLSMGLEGQTGTILHTVKPQPA